MTFSPSNLPSCSPFTGGSVHPRPAHGCPFSLSLHRHGLEWWAAIISCMPLLPWSIGALQQLCAGGPDLYDASPLPFLQWGGHRAFLVLGVPHMCLSMVLPSGFCGPLLCPLLLFLLCAFYLFCCCYGNDQ